MNDFISDIHSVLDEVKPIYQKLAAAYDYYEIQYHNCAEQKEYNLWLYAMSQKYNKPLIAATDTHSLNKYKAECRKILLKILGCRPKSHSTSPGTKLLLPASMQGLPGSRWKVELKLGL